MSQVGKISVPSAIQSEDEAEESSYNDAQLKTAISDAYPKVLEIITGKISHPIIKFSKDATMESTGTKIDQAVNFHRSHPIPILPSDATIVTPYLKKLMAEVGVTPNRDLLIFGVAKVLFELVIIRSYLNLTPAHDAHIYEAWSQRLLHRRFTPEERALEACRTDRVLIDGRIVAQTPSHLHRTGFKVKYSNTLLTRSFIVDHGPIVWEKRLQHSLDMVKTRPLPTKRVKRKWSQSPLEDIGSVPTQPTHQKRKRRVR